MNKQNKLVLKAVKAALRVVEATEKARARQDIEYGTSSTLRPGGTYRPNTDSSPEPPMGKNPIVSLGMDCEPGKPILYYAERKSVERERISKEVYDELSAYFLDQKLSTLHGSCAPSTRYCVNEKDLQAIEKTGDEPILRGRWKAEDMPKKGITEKLILAGFAGEDTPYVEKLLERAIDDPKAFSQPYAYFEKTGARLVHLKSPELGTETLVVLSPEGETLLKIVKDNSRKFEVR